MGIEATRIRTIGLLPGLLLFAALLAGCGGKPDQGAGPPILALGQDVCAACGMTISDPVFAAAARFPDGGDRAYDAIECLVGDLRRKTGAAAPTAIWLADFPAQGRLHPAAEMTVVWADFASPMGGGFAAFADADQAAEAAAARSGVAGPLAGFVDGSLRKDRR